jgi:hypothetical protein
VIGTERASPMSEPWSPLGARDVLILAAFLLVTAVPTGRLLATPAAREAGGAARVAMGREAVNRGAIASGHLPLWNPYHFGGRPHLADADSLALYPPHLLLRFLPLDVFFPVSFILHTWLMGVGVYVTARRLEAARVAAAAAMLAACGSALAPYDASIYSPQVAGLAWLPLLVMLALRSAARPTWRPHPGLVVVTALALTASARGPLYVLLTIAGAYLVAAMWPARTGHALTRFMLLQPAVLGCLAAGLAAFQLMPVVRFWTTMRGANEVALMAPRDDVAAASVDASIAGALASARPRGRILSVCDRVLDASGLVALGLPGVGGEGGVLLANYGRYANLARGPQAPVRTLFAGIPEAARPARSDLLSLLGVEYLVACEPPDPRYWAPVWEGNRAGVYRNLTAVSRAFWTCAPVSVGRQEIEHRLRRGRYDSSFVLRTDVIIHVRWAPAVGAADRARLEAEFHIVPQRDLGDRTWQYRLLDVSPDNVLKIVTAPAAEDTQYIDRGTGLLAASATAVPAFDEPKSESLLGGGACDAPVPGTVSVQDRFDGGMRTDVNAPRDGIVYFSETYYPDRRAWVDGHRVPRVRVNLAFTGVPVTAGQHRIELRYDMRAVWIGAGVSGGTLLVWLVVLRRPNAHRA